MTPYENTRIFRSVVLLTAGMLLAGGLLAPGTDAFARSWVGTDAAPTQAEQKPSQLRGVGIEEQLEEKLPLDLTFRDSRGKRVTLGDYFSGDKPVILAPVYFRCPKLCSLTLNGIADLVADLERWTPGQEYEIVVFSFDPEESAVIARQKKQTLLKRANKAGAGEGWHFLVGDQPTIRKLTRAVGFNYRYLPNEDEYAHTAALVLCSPRGKITRYIYGIQYPAETVRLSLVEASEGTVGSSLDQFVLYCFTYDPDSSSYAMVARRVMTLGGLVTVVLVFGVLGTLWLRDFLKHGGVSDGTDADGAAKPSDGSQAQRAWKP